MPATEREEQEYSKMDSSNSVSDYSIHISHCLSFGVCACSTPFLNCKTNREGNFDANT